MGSWLSQGGDRLTFSTARLARKFKLTFPSRDERAISPHVRILQSCPQSQRGVLRREGESGERRFPTVASASRGQVSSPLAEMKKKKGPGAILTLHITKRATRSDRRPRRYIRGRRSA